MNPPRRPAASSRAQAAPRVAGKPVVPRASVTPTPRRAPSTGTIRTSTKAGSGPGRSQRIRTGAASSSATTPTITPSGPGGSWAAMLTWRTAVIVAVLGLAFAVVWPSVRAYLDQQDMLNGLRAEAASAQQEVEDLTAEVARWDDDAYIEAQARERLRYVFPGETGYRVIDPETAQDPASAPTDGEGGQAARDADTWYDALWQSVESAGANADADATASTTTGEESAAGSDTEAAN